MRTATTTSPGNNAVQAPSPPRRRPHVLHRYRGDQGATRELVARPAAHGTMLVVDRDLLTRGDERLLAHLAADEPRENALLAVEQYLGAEPSARRCRELEPGDATAVPFPAPGPDELRDVQSADPVGAPACAFRLRLVSSGMSIPALRWTRDADAVPAAPVSLREAIATLESYEPLRRLTRAALARYDDDQSVSCTVLRAELARVLESSIVLNRGLREAVVQKVSAGGVSMSEIAMRCGRLKRDSKGNATGETSWLARRVGLLPEGGHAQPTRWVHSDVLALIARQGLGIAPREVELG
jgi:hypothetical protein